MQVQQQRSGSFDLLIAIAIPLALLALAYALWAISDHLLQIGPFDRAAFGWIFVFPISWLAPGIAGLVWSRMPTARVTVAALVVGGIVAVASAILLALAIDYANCAPVTSRMDNLPASLAIGLVIGAGPSIGALAAATVARRLTGWGCIVGAVATGGAIGFVGLLAALITFVSLFPVVSCAFVPR